MQRANSVKKHTLTKNDFSMSGENFHIEMSNDYPYYIGVPHSHEFIEIVYVISGSAIHSVEGKSAKAKRGDLFIINTDTTHCFLTDDTDSEPLISYDLKFTPEFFDASLSEAKDFESLNNIFMFYTLFHSHEEHMPSLSVSGDLFSEFGELFNKIYLEFTQKEKGYLEIIRAYLTELIIIAFRKSENQSKKALPNANSHIVDYISTYIKNNFSSSISIKKLSSEVGLNADYMGRIFKEKTGNTISETIQKVRIANACEFLSSTDDTIDDISRKCGFEDERFFYKVFSRFMGMTPGVYRKNQNK